MQRGCAALLIALATLGACKKKDDAPRATGSGSSNAALATSDPGVERPPTKIDGPSVTPTITSSITFFVPKQFTWWGEFAFPCYAAAIHLQPGNRPSDAFTKISPLVEPALRAADVDLDKDVSAIGAWGCGEDGACIYVALQLRNPDKLKDLLAVAVPNTQPKQLGKHHWVIEAPGVQGPRTIHLRAIPIAWPTKLPGDTWSREAAHATHLVFLTGMMGKTSEVDPLTAAADAKTAAAKVADVESIVPNASGRCIVGDVAKRSFQPGYELDRSRFVLSAPEGKSDPLTALLGSKRTLDLEVELVLSPAASDQVVRKWIAQARAFIGATMDPLRAQFAAQGPIVDAMFELGALLGKSGFRHTLKDKSLTLSFRTDRITQAELSSVESKLEGAMKQMGVTP